MREIIAIDIDRLTMFEDNYYMSYLDADLTNYNALKRSISELGLKVPISIRDASTNNINNYSFKIIDGRLRYLACKELGHKTIDCHVMSSTDFDIMVEQIIPSRPRVETSPEEYAKLIQIMLENNPEMTIEQLGEKICKSPNWIKEKLFINGHFNLLDNLTFVESEKSVPLTDLQLAKLIKITLKRMTIEELSKNMGESVQWIEEKLSLVQET